MDGKYLCGLEFLYRETGRVFKFSSSGKGTKYLSVNLFRAGRGVTAMRGSGEGGRQQ